VEAPTQILNPKIFKHLSIVVFEILSAVVPGRTPSIIKKIVTQ